MTTTFTNPHTTEVAHDTELLRLMRLEAEAVYHVGVEAARLTNRATTGYVDYRGHRTMTNGNMMRTAVDEFPVGTIYKQAKTYTRGEEGTYVALENGGRRPVTIADVLDMFDDDATCNAYHAAVDARDEARAAVVAHELNYTGWARFFLVVTSAGHVHKDMYCNTCYPTTGYAPLPGLAGATEAEAVALVGPALCTVCFPLAPTDTTGVKITEAMGLVLLNEGEEAFRAKIAEAAAKADTKCTHKIPVPDTGNGPRAYRRYATCGGCGATGVSVTSVGNLRAHKKPVD